ncbi:MAG: thioesterase family protein [Hyphomicrobiaceae bacterium]|nr:thioesterase family protein [Hyphomicrobiaceae bacterium]
MLDRADFKEALKFVFEEKIPFCKTLGLKFSLDGGRAEVHFRREDFMLGNVKYKVLHGGVTASVLDSIAGIAILCRMAELDPKPDVIAQLKEFGRISTIDLRVDYIEPANAEAFVATADVLRVGNRVANVQMRMLDADDGRCLAVGSAAFALRAARSEGGI